MWPDRVWNSELLTYESGALPTALRGPAINAWNQLPEFVISSTSVNGFKNTIDTHFREIYEVSNDSVA